jgi:hypothetical protein
MNPTAECKHFWKYLFKFEIKLLHDTLQLEVEGTCIRIPYIQSVFNITYPKVYWKTLREKYVIRTFKCIVLSAAPCTFINFLLRWLYNMKSPIPVMSGVRQGCMLSPIIFLVIMDEVMKKTTEGK